MMGMAFGNEGFRLRAIPGPVDPEEAGRGSWGRRESGERVEGGAAPERRPLGGGGAKRQISPSSRQRRKSSAETSKCIESSRPKPAPQIQPSSVK